MLGCRPSARLWELPEAVLPASERGPTSPSSCTVCIGLHTGGMLPSCPHPTAACLPLTAVSNVTSMLVRQWHFAMVRLARWLTAAGSSRRRSI